MCEKLSELNHANIDIDFISDTISTERRNNCELRPLLSNGRDKHDIVYLSGGEINCWLTPGMPP